MQRPTSVTVLGILNIGFAAFGVLGVLGTLMLFAATGANSYNPVVRLIHDSPAYAAWLRISVVLGLIVGAGLLAAGIGLLKLRPWARTLSIAYAIYAIVMVPAAAIVNFVVLVQPMLAQAHGKQGPEEAAAIGGAMAGTFGGCLGLVYPIVLLIFMLRANVVAAFRQDPIVPPEGLS